jgi:hypothetical protein
VEWIHRFGHCRVNSGHFDGRVTDTNRNLEATGKPAEPLRNSFKGRTSKMGDSFTSWSKLLRENSLTEKKNCICTKSNYCRLSLENRVELYYHQVIKINGFFFNAAQFKPLKRDSFIVPVHTLTA